MKSKTLMYFSAFLAISILLAGACSGGFLIGRMSTNQLTQPYVLNPYQIITQAASEANQSSPSNPLSSSGTPDNLKTLFTPFWDTWKIIHTDYIAQPVDDIKLMQGAIRGMLESLGDKHTSYMDPDQFRKVNIYLVQEYDGIGAWVDTNTEYLTIISPMPGSPAEKAGIKSGDMVIAVDGQDMTGVDGNLVLRKVLGPAGSKVSLTIRRSSEKDTIVIEIVRAKITIPSVDGRMLENKIAYIQIFRFAGNTRTELRKTMEKLLVQKPIGLIVDLRNNGGGYVTTAVEVASEFIDKGVVLQEEYSDGKRKKYESLGGGLAYQIPLVVLINEGSASASEIVAGAIQDYSRGKLIGTTSYGKGSVQEQIPLSNDQGAIRVTVAHWLTPKGRQINDVGLKPDVEVSLSEADVKANIDRQLDKAVEQFIVQ